MQTNLFAKLLPFLFSASKIGFPNCDKVSLPRLFGGLSLLPNESITRFMSKLKTLKESRAAVFAKIDELRTATDGREMTSEEQERWNTLLAEYEQADRAVEAEERYVDIERRQAEQRYAQQISGEQPDERRAEEYRTAFRDYLLRGAADISPEHRTLFEQRAGITGLSGGVIVPSSLADSIEVALKAYGGMFEAGSILTTSKGGDLIMPTVNDTDAKATVVAEYQQSTKSAPSFGSETLKADIVNTLRKVVSPFFLRRVKSDIDIYLPRKVEVLVYTEMTSYEKELYSLNGAVI